MIFTFSYTLLVLVSYLPFILGDAMFLSQIIFQPEMATSVIIFEKISSKFIIQTLLVEISNWGTINF